MHKNNMNKNKPLKNKKEALEYCEELAHLINESFSKEDSEVIVNDFWNFCSENDLKPTIDELDRAIVYFLEEKEYKKQKEEWRKRSIWKKIVFDNDRRLRTIIGVFIFCLPFSSVFWIVMAHSYLRTYYIGKECPLGTEPSWLKRSCVEVVCNGSAIDEKGIIDQRRLYFLDTFIYNNGHGCVSKCANLDEEYHQNNVISTKSSFGDNRRPSYYYYYYWKDGKCNLLPWYKNTLSRDIELRRKKEDQELADKIKKEEDALKEYFLRILEENKEYYKKARYNY